MEFKFISRKNIDIRKWNKLVHASSQSYIYQTTFYLDVVAPKWEALVGGDYEIVFPIAYKKIGPYFIAYQPFFTREFSFLGNKKINAKDAEVIVALFEKRYSKMHFCTSTQLPVLSGYKIENWTYQRLRLGGTTNFSENARRLIAKSKKQAIQISTSTDVKAFLKLFRKEKGKAIRDLTSSHFKMLEQLMTTGLKNKYGKLFVAHHHEAIAYAYFWFYNDKIIYLKGTVTQEGKKHGAMYAIFDHVIHTFDTYTYLDFGGSRIASIAQFYKKFGATDVEYQSFTRGKLPFAIELLKKTKAALKK